jgi:hypothetical protein
VRIPAAGGEKDDTVPFDFTFAGGSPLIEPIPERFKNDRARPAILSRIAHIPLLLNQIHCGESIRATWELSNSDQQSLFA